MSESSEKRVLVTGAGGFIASHLIPRLISCGMDVHTMDKNFAPWSKHHVMGLEDAQGIRQLVASIEPEIVFHLGAGIDHSQNLCDPHGVMETNLGGTINMLSALEKTEFELFINTGTCEEYGDNKPPFTEDQPPNPVSPYSCSKASATLFCMMCHKTFGMPTATLRPFLTYGPGQGPGLLIPDSIMSGLKGEDINITRGHQTRDINYVSDIVEAYLLTAKKRPKGHIINAGSGIETRISELVQKIVIMTGSKSRINKTLPYRSSESMRFFCDNSKAKKMLGWKPRVKVEEGLEMTIRWFRQKNS